MDGISAAERQPTYPEGGPKDNETYAEDGSGEDDIDTEDGSRQHGCDRKGGGEEGFDTEGGSEEDGDRCLGPKLVASIAASKFASWKQLWRL